jgi:hypothetical protein
MQTLKPEMEERNLEMENLAPDLEQYWRKRLLSECQQTEAARESILKWLLGEESERFLSLTNSELTIATQAIEYRYRILQLRYLGVGPEKAYRNLINRLSSLFLLRNKIRTWVSLSRDRQRSVIDVLQEVLQELLQSDRYMQQQMSWIAKNTADVRLRNALVFASAEEYCMRPIRNQPLLVYRFVNYLRRTQRGGLTQVPSNDLIRLVSEEILSEDSDNPINLLDHQAQAAYLEEQVALEQQAARDKVKQEFADYLTVQVGPQAALWLKLYLQGKSQDAIAKQLGWDIQQVYRLREKISYHAVRVFALKNQPELVSSWLEISLPNHGFGLTPKQLEQLSSQLNPIGRQILNQRLTEQSWEAIALELKLKPHQVMGEWTKVYLAAQALRNQG